MGNYKNIEHDFVERTMNLISQYDSILYKYEFDHQYNYTLLLNCMLGVIVMPKDRVYTHIPNPIITPELKKKMGLFTTSINPSITHLREFIHALRNSVAHFSVQIISKDENNLIDRIEFHKPDNYGGGIIADFDSVELLPFMRYYASWLRTQLIENHIR